MKKQSIYQSLLMGSILLIFSALVACNSAAPVPAESPLPTEEPVAGTEEPVAGTEEPVAGTEEPVAGREEPVAGTEEPVAESAQVLTIYNWDTYIDPDILTDFEERFDVVIDYRIFENDVEILEAMRSGPVDYDVIVPSAIVATAMRQESLLHPLNKEKIPNFEHISSELFINPVYDPGNRYCVPYQWGTAGIGYNREATGREIQSFADLFDPAYAGRVALIDDARTSLGMVLLHLGHSANTTDRTQIAQARDFLMERADQIAFYSADDGQELLASGEVDLTTEWSGDILQVMADNPAIEYALPEEGSILWTDVMCIPATAPHKELAENFVNYMLEPEVGAALSEYIQYASPNSAALSLINEADRENPVLYPPAEDEARLFFLTDLGADAEAFYQEVWAEVLAHHSSQQAQN